VFTSDPATTNGSPAELIPRIGAGALLARKLDTLPVDALVLQLMAYAKHQKEIQIVNGLTPGNITKALQGEHVGTLVHAD
jgi:molybdenum storage protein